MTPLAFLLVVMSEVCSSSGQLFFKRAMGGKGKMGLILTAGIVVKALGFFIWEGLLSKMQLSYLYPFDALNGIFLTFAASLLLKEKMSLSLWVGVILICAGVLLVSRS